MSKIKKPKPGLESYFYMVTGRVLTRKEVRDAQREWISKNKSEIFSINMDHVPHESDAIHPNLESII